MATTDPGTDLVLAPARGLPRGLTVPAAELLERFSRSSGPGGQSVNTADSRVELRYDASTSAALTDPQRERIVAALGPVITVVAAEHRSQLRNRIAARQRLVVRLTDALAPDPPARRARRPSKAARAARVADKRARGELKAGRRRPTRDDRT